MSHFKERAEKKCLNCDAEVAGKYCQQCGQENVEPKIGIGHLVLHFFNDITHFDGKFFSTMKLLLLRPGFLSKEYIIGRRMKYLDPIRMYLFISALFFVLFYSFTGVAHFEEKYGDSKIFSTSKKKLTPEQAYIVDSIRAVALSQGGSGDLQILDHPYDTTSKIKVLNLAPEYQHGQAYYDSIQRSLPPAKRDDFIDRYFAKRQIGMYKAYLKDPDGFWVKGFVTFLHSLSKIAFITMPLFAIFLELLYIRRYKKFYFVSHVIFTLHVYCVTYLLMIFMVFASYIPGGLGGWAQFLLSGSTLVYLYLAMLRFYQQGWFKTFIKFFILSFLSTIMLLILSGLLLLNSYLTIGVH